LAKAPKDWKMFLKWAEQNISKPVKPTVFKGKPKLPAPKWSVQRLDKVLDQAEATCTWTPPPSGPEALVALGPFHSDMSAPDFNAQIKDRRRGRSLQLKISGFSLRREDIGEIMIELRQPFGNHFDLIWSRAGSIRIPIPDNKKFWPLHILTDGLPEWSGPLRTISLYTDGVGTDPVEVRSIRFLGRQESFPEPVGVRRVTIDHEMRTALYAHGSADIRFPNLDLPEMARFHVGLGLVAGEEISQQADSGSNTLASIAFELLVEKDGKQTPVFKREILSGSTWADVQVELEKWAGSVDALILRTVSGSASIVACWGNPVVYEAVDKSPLVIVYLIDCLGAKHVDLYGYSRPTTPHLAKLAGKGAWFSNMFANSPRTIESIPDLMLSIPTVQHMVTHPSIVADQNFVTLAEAMNTAGFATISFSTNVNAGPQQNMDQGFDTFFDRIAYWWSKNGDRTVPIEDAQAWLLSHRDRPKFMYIHTAEPHAPYSPPLGFAGRFDTGYRGQIDGTFHQGRGIRNAATAEDVAHVVSLYDEEVAYADSRLGMFMDMLRTNDLLENIYLLVTADHGEEFLEHNHWTHGKDLHNELLRVPLVIVGPTVTRRGRIDQAAQLHDLMPTILDFLDIPLPYALAGQSLRSLLDVDMEAPDHLVNRTLYSSNFSYERHDVVEYSAIEGARWKLMYRYDIPQHEQGGMDENLPPNRLALFDLQNDYHEKRNVLNDHPNIVRRMVGRLLAWRQTYAPVVFEAKASKLELDSEQLMQLRSLGYISDN
jgi:arylsulfatase A-like enzyme